MDSIFPSKVEYKQIDTFIALCDGLIYDTTVDEIKDVIALISTGKASRICQNIYQTIANTRV